jgi:inhibitor of cysteine peptidase
MRENREIAPVEEKWIEEAKKTAELVEVPKSLLPEAVTARLKTEGRKQKEAPAKFHKYLAQAAVLFLFLLLGGGSLWLFRQLGGDKGSEGVKQETEALEIARAAAPEEGQSLPGSYQAADSFEEIYQYLKGQKRAFMDEDGAFQVTEAAVGEQAGAPEALEYEEAPAESSMKSEAADAGKAAAENKEHSETNTQVKGIDEADIVKTDGKYLYVVYAGEDFAGRVHIIETDGGVMREVSKTEPVTKELYRDYDSVLELYVDGDTMTVLMDCIDEESAESYTVTAVYDISDREKPKLTGTLRQDGIYKSSRKNGSHVYVFTMKHTDVREENDKSSYLPYVWDGLIGWEDIYYSPEVETNQMLIVTALDTNGPEQFTDKKAVFCSGDTIYVSQNAIYAAETIYGEEKSQTELFKLSYKEGKFEAEGSRRVLGRLNNQFSMDEYQGYLRFVATVDDYRNGGQVNSLYVMDREMEIVGSIHNLAPDERIYSARFMGDTGYFVTFRETDPLFSVDLSDPEEPKIMGELKITGFSSYLHGYSEHMLLGIGEEINPRTGAQEGLKLSMFNTEDPYNVTEEDKEVLTQYQGSEALSDHKAVLIDTEKNLFGFLAWGYQRGVGEYYDYLLYSYDEEWGFTERFSIKFSWEEVSGGYVSGLRGVYIGDTLYLIGFTDGVRAYSMKSGMEIGRLNLN